MITKIDPVRQPIIDNTSPTPFDVINLPSKGLMYPESSPLRSGIVEIFYMNASDEDILTSPNLIESGEFITVLLRAKIRNRQINVLDLLKCDVDAILVWLRSSGYGPEYPVTVRCSACNHKYDNEFDLSSLETKELDEGLLNSNSLFEFVLPSGPTVQFSLLSLFDEEEVKKENTKLKKQLNIKYSQNSTLLYSRLIKVIGDNSDNGYIRKFVSSMSLKDSRALKREIVRVSPGIIMEQFVTCPNCQHSEDVDIPITSSFFWPDS